MEWKEQNSARQGCLHTVFDGVLHRPQAVAHGVFYLSKGVFVGAFDQEGDGARVATLLDEGVLLLSLSWDKHRSAGWGGG